jgi:hypothetical protein
MAIWNTGHLSGMDALLHVHHHVIVPTMNCNLLCNAENGNLIGIYNIHMYRQIKLRLKTHGKKL